MYLVTIQYENEPDYSQKLFKNKQNAENFQLQHQEEEGEGIVSTSMRFLTVEDIWD